MTTLICVRNIYSQKMYKSRGFLVSQTIRYPELLCAKTNFVHILGK